MPGGNDAWGPRADLSTAGGIVGRRLREFAGLSVESLLLYHRPVFEDGTIEYEFFYRPGDVECHPAVDRLAFLLEPAGVRIHWITDGVHDRTELAADNACAEAACRRGPNALALAADAWNQVALEFAGDIVRLRLNGQLVYERTLEPTNQRTFGLFHYADQTEALVRNVIWRGTWPRELPPVSQQELAGTYGDFLNARRAELTDTFQHDFARDAAPSDRFAIDSQATDLSWSPAADGLHVAFDPAGGDRIVYVAPRLTVGGDFDVTVGFEALAASPGAGGKTMLILQARLDNPTQNEGFVYRAAVAGANATIDQLCQASIARRPGGELRQDFSDRIMFEANAGRLRLARRGDTVYFLVAENDSPNFRLLQMGQIGSEDLVHEGLRILTQMKDAGQAEVVWKSFEVRAERLSGPAVENWPQVVAELDRQRESLADKFVHDFTRDELTVARFHQWNGNPERPAPGGLRLAHRGTETWTNAGLVPHVAIRGDFDVTLDINETRFDPPNKGDKFSVFLHVELPTELKQGYSSIFSVDDAGRHRALPESYVQKPDGSLDRRWPHEEPARPFRRLRLARRGTVIYVLYSSDTTHPDRLLGRFPAADVDVAETGIRITVHAGGEGRTAEAWLKQLSIRAEQLTLKPAASD